jgi:hypothetical protein
MQVICFARIYQDLLLVERTVGIAGIRSLVPSSSIGY